LFLPFFSFCADLTWFPSSFFPPFPRRPAMAKAALRFSFRLGWPFFFFLQWITSHSGFFFSLNLSSCCRRPTIFSDGPRLPFSPSFLLQKKAFFLGASGSFPSLPPFPLVRTDALLRSLLDFFLHFQYCRNHFFPGRQQFFFFPFSPLLTFNDFSLDSSRPTAFFSIGGDGVISFSSPLYFARTLVNYCFLEDQRVVSWTRASSGSSLEIN